jgi:hypothetical protein
VSQYVLKNGCYVKFVNQPFFFTFFAVCILFLTRSSLSSSSSYYSLSQKL